MFYLWRRALQTFGKRCAVALVAAVSVAGALGRLVAHPSAEVAAATSRRSRGDSPISARFARAERWLWALGWLFAAAASIVPAPLLEARYFTVPLVFFLLRVRYGDEDEAVDEGGAGEERCGEDRRASEGSRARAACEAGLARGLVLAAHLALAAAVYFLFLRRPFRWPDGSIARIMW
jgi:hypothetical protein